MRIRKKYIIKKCTNCGNEFLAASNKGKFCSESCKQKNKRKVKKINDAEKKAFKEQMQIRIASEKEYSHRLEYLKNQSVDTTCHYCGQNIRFRNLIISEYELKFNKDYYHDDCFKKVSKNGFYKCVYKGSEESDIEKVKKLLKHSF